jgi:ornithine cyclodeaminase/alanine dehydrogenase-like protein (mu-crystallin family)
LVHSRDAARREEFARRMSERLGIEVVAVSEPRMAVEDLPIVVTATSSRQPVLTGQWLAHGAFLAAVGSNWLNKAEIDEDAIERAALVVCDDIACCQHEAGDFVPALREGKFDWSRAVNLADIVAGRHPGRARADDLVLFKSVGMALEDVAVAHKLVELARAQNVGADLPL